MDDSAAYALESQRRRAGAGREEAPGTLHRAARAAIAWWGDANGSGLRAGGRRTGA